MSPEFLLHYWNRPQKEKTDFSEIFADFSEKMIKFAPDFSDFHQKMSEINHKLN